MRLRFKIEDYEKVYGVLVDKLGYEQDVFLTDDCIEVEEEDLNTIKQELPDVCFKTI